MARSVPAGAGDVRKSRQRETPLADALDRNLFFKGRAMCQKTMDFADYARLEINELGGYYAFGPELVDGDAVYAFDRTKLSVHTRDIGLAGIEVYDYLRDDYGIQIEFGDVGNLLAIISCGDRMMDIERLISAFEEIKRQREKSPIGLFDHEYIDPVIAMAPQEAFYAKKRRVPMRESTGLVAALWDVWDHRETRRRKMRSGSKGPWKSECPSRRGEARR